MSFHRRAGLEVAVVIHLCYRSCLPQNGCQANRQLIGLPDPVGPGYMLIGLSDAVRPGCSHVTLYNDDIALLLVMFIVMIVAVVVKLVFTSQ